MKNKRIIFYILIILYLIVTLSVITGNMNKFDEVIYNTIISIRSDQMDLFFKIITCFANTWTVIAISILLVMILDKKDKILLMSSIGCSVGFNLGFKYLIQRIRPNHLRLITENGYSYPSGHAMISIALYGMMLYYIYKKEKNRYLKLISISFLVVLIIFIGISRIYLGVHYPSDILGGYLLSSAIMLMIIDRGKLYDKNGS